MIGSILCIPGAAPCFIEHFTQLMMIIRGTICGYWAPPGMGVFLFQAVWRTSYHQCVVPYYKSVKFKAYNIILLVSLVEKLLVFANNNSVFLYTKPVYWVIKHLISPGTCPLLTAGSCVHWFYGRDVVMPISNRSQHAPAISVSCFMLVTKL